MTPRREKLARRTALSLLTAHNVIQNRFLNERGYVTGNLVVTATLVAIGSGAGLDRHQMGLATGDIRGGLRIGGASVVAGAVFVTAAARIPTFGAHLCDERAAANSGPEAIRRALTRFPLGTALFEEVAFRGVLPPLLATGSSPVSGDVRSAVVFGLWHLIPAHHALRVNRVDAGPLQRLAGTLLGATAAAIAGYGLGQIENRTRSLIAPWLIHSSVNAGSFLGVVFSRSSR